MVSERTASDRLVGRLVSYGEPEGVFGRLGMGMFLLRRVYEGYLSRGAATRELPVDGIKEGLVAHGQAGQLYRHLYFHIGCRFLGWPGMLASWFMHQVDVRQAAAGRIEINGRGQGQFGGIRVRRGSVGPVAAQDISAGGGGAVAKDPGGMRVTAQNKKPSERARVRSRFAPRTRSTTFISVVFYRALLCFSIRANSIIFAPTLSRSSGVISALNAL